MVLTKSGEREQALKSKECNWRDLDTRKFGVRMKYSVLFGLIYMRVGAVRYTLKIP